MCVRVTIPENPTQKSGSGTNMGIILQIIKGFFLHSKFILEKTENQSS